MRWGIHKHPHLPLEKKHYISLITGAEAGIATSAAIIVGLVDGFRALNVIVPIAMLFIAVQAFNSSMSRYSSLITTEEIEEGQSRLRIALGNATIQFIAHVSAGSTLLLALIWTNTVLTNLLAVSITSLLLLLLLGLWKGHTLEQSKFHTAKTTLLIGSLMMIFGLFIGQIVGAI